MQTNTARNDFADFIRRGEPKKSAAYYAALRYLNECKFSVIPVGKDKKPLIKWQEYQKRLPTEQEIRGWFEQWPDANCAIVTGAISALCVVDLDEVANAKEALNDLIPDSLTFPVSKTPSGGEHWFFSCTDPNLFNNAKVIPGADLRANGGFVVAPPSVGDKGNWAWLPALDIFSTALPPLPDAYIEAVKKPAVINEKSNSVKDLLAGGATVGSRNDSLAKTAGVFFAKGLSFEQTLQNCLAWNRLNTPPLDEGEVSATVESIHKIHLRSEPVEEDWPEPIPFDSYNTLPDFPINALPELGQRIVGSVSEINQVDVGLTASIYLAVTSASVSKKAEVDLISHREPININIAGILLSGERKSSTLNLMARPVYKYQEQKQQEKSEIIRQALNSHKIREARLAKLQKQAAHTDNSVEARRFEAEAAELVKEIAENPVPALPILIADDITPEKTAILMSENGERLSILSTEGGIFGILAGRYNEKGINIDLFLKAHSGDPYSCHRVGRDPQTMQAPCLTMCLTVQPDVIREIGINNQFRGRGLLARFLYSHCKTQAGSRQRQIKSVPESLLSEYQRHIFSLLNIPLAANILRLSPEGQALWDAFYNDVESEMRPGGDLEYIKDWGSKLPGAVARIAGLLHFAEYGAEATNKSISVNIVSASCAIGGYYLQHAIAAFGLMEADPRLETAKKILDYIKRHRPASFKGRDVLRHTNLKTVDDVSEGLKVLCERGFIKEGTFTYSGQGRPEARGYKINPKVVENP